MKQPSIIKSCSGFERHRESAPLTFFSGIQLREIEVRPSAVPPINIIADVVLSAEPGCEDSARDVARTGPITPAKFIIAESTA